MAQDERRGFEIVDDFSFILRISKHSEPFRQSASRETLDRTDHAPVPAPDRFSILIVKPGCLIKT